MNDRRRRAALAISLLVGGCAWSGAAQRRTIVEERHGEIVAEHRRGGVITFVWRPDHWHYNKWVCNVGARDCFVSYSVDQAARSCGIGHGGPEQRLECAGLKGDEDLARYIGW